MFEDITRTIRDSIRKDMKEKFGLSDAESEHSSRIILDRIREIFSEEHLKNNLDQVREFFQGMGGGANAAKDKFTHETINELIQKVGLSEEKARRIRDFSFDRYIEQAKSMLAQLEDKLEGNEFRDLLSRLNPENLEESAKKALDNLKDLFRSGH
jgi:endonuclease III